MGNLIATCMFSDKRTCSVTCCSLAKCQGCIWGRISKKRISKPETERLKQVAKVIYWYKEMKLKCEPTFSTQYHIKPEYESKKGVIMVTKLEVTYKSQGIDEELDRQIEKFFKSIGFSRWASGYDLMSSERDLAFEKRGEGEHASKRSKEAQLTT